MPLSKARDKARKQKERAKFRLDKLLSPPQTSKPVQPSNAMPNFVKNRSQSMTYVEIDADGNPIYEEE